MYRSTPVARRLVTAAGGLALIGGAMLATAAPALAAPNDQATSTDHTGTNPAGGQHASSDPAAIDGQAPTPAAQGAQYGAEPETVIAGVPLEGTLESAQRSTAILPGAGPVDYA